MSQPAQTLLRVYGESSLPGLAQANGLPTEAALDVLEEHFKDRKARQKVIDALSTASRGLLAFMDQLDRRVRGERLKKRWFLHGYNDFETAVEPLVRQGLVIAGNLQAREPLALELVLEQGVLQQWLQVTPGFQGMAGEPPEQREVIEHVEDETTVFLSRRTLVVEFNMLTAWTWVQRHPVRLNRDGSAHRSDLKVLAPLLIDRRALSGGAVMPDPNIVEGWDTIVFVLSMVEALGLVERRGDLLVAVADPAGYFQKPIQDRLPLLHRAFEQQRVWTEPHAAEWMIAGEPPVTGQGHGAFPEPKARSNAWAGPRGSLLAALRRLQLLDWFEVDETCETIVSLEKDYLRTSIPSLNGGEIDVRGFVDAFLRHALPHLGVLELGRGSTGQLRARLTEFGKAFVGLGEKAEEPTGAGAIVVEPSYEVTCFIDLASIPLLHDLARFAEVVRTDERVVRYRLSGESAQYGYARGYTADRVLEILQRYAHQETPSNVAWALRDWERLHRRVTVYLAGDLVAAGPKGDPEILQSGLVFAIDREDDVEKVGLDFTFVSAGPRETLERALTANQPMVIDYTGPIVPTLRWVDEERIEAPVGNTDLRTLSRLQRYCVDEGGGLFRIDRGTLEKRCSEGEGYQRLLELLREGVVGGLSPERELTVKTLLGQPATARIARLEVLLIGSDEDGERVARCAALQPLLKERLGPRAFCIRGEEREAVLAQLAELGVRTDEPAP